MSSQCRATSPCWWVGRQHYGAGEGLVVVDTQAAAAAPQVMAAIRLSDTPIIG